ncbi:imidazole glycerol phosphate synthase subunit HisH [Verrucomicrobiaceae bacterium R5-34]|uniref:Imidazole glycerol phosphate synthase subunit HisH n=1 Tax=Oceaniferula flava TaxID=2800421 RepID=A0AAE2SD93_9BACT|nr:imidazole glycerol phosphate synthase subunit HisH [Oceaniferula flavus]MBK1830261.1 imidazole glycerol phosphate synthase subunit HisH [Verrucomicrobiaceae bacterium R5-34]MBK1854852.1 imidazole glycerol phosphate synthase subunit HisH [Oceaniferula flavus]MBM1136158.1 imidazole glycerol phosphate synthase subunit HisH [Oceaniferula flavus]
MKVGIVDYGRGNIRSVENAFLAIGADVCLITTPEELEGITHLVVPGQGEFGDCAANLKKQGMFGPIQEWAAADKPYLGICVGYQLIFDSGEESPDAEGLGIMRGAVKRFPDVGLKIPHMGWNSVKLTDPGNPLWKDLPDEPFFYFVHSYYPEPENQEHTAAICDYALPFAAAVTRGKLIATQFHPEKSQHNGLQLLKNFCAIEA